MSVIKKKIPIVDYYTIDFARFLLYVLTSSHQGIVGPRQLLSCGAEFHCKFIKFIIFIQILRATT